MNCLSYQLLGELPSYKDLSERLGCPASGRDRLYPLSRNVYTIICVFDVGGERDIGQDGLDVGLL